MSRLSPSSDRLALYVFLGIMLACAGFVAILAWIVFR